MRMFVVASFVTVWALSIYIMLKIYASKNHIIEGFKRRVEDLLEDGAEHLSDLAKLRIEHEKLRLSHDSLFQIIHQRTEESFVDPQLRCFRILLPKELTQMKESAYDALASDPNGVHSSCHTSILSVLHTFGMIEEARNI